VYLPSFSSKVKVQYRVLRIPTTSTLIATPFCSWI
jgi:hypothetical protein